MNSQIERTCVKIGAKVRQLNPRIELIGSYDKLATHQKSSIAAGISELRQKLLNIESSMHSMTAPEVTRQAEKMNQILYRDLLPSTRWDVLEWNYFEEDELFSCQSQEVKCDFPSWLKSEISDAKIYVDETSESLRNCLSTSSLSGYYATLNDHTRYLIDYDGPNCDASMRFDLIRKTTGFELVNKLEFSHARMPLIVVLLVSKHNVDFLPKFLNALKNYKSKNIKNCVLKNCKKK